MLSKMAKWSAEELEETLPDASSDNSTSILLNDNLDDGSLPNASFEQDSMLEASLEEDSSLPDASLDISDSNVNDPELSKESASS